MTQLTVKNDYLVLNLAFVDKFFIRPSRRRQLFAEGRELRLPYHSVRSVSVVPDAYSALMLDIPLWHMYPLHNPNLHLTFVIVGTGGNDTVPDLFPA